MVCCLLNKDFAPWGRCYFLLGDSESPILCIRCTLLFQNAVHFRCETWIAASAENKVLGKYLHVERDDVVVWDITSSKYSRFVRLLCESWVWGNKGTDRNCEPAENSHLWGWEGHGGIMFTRILRKQFGRVRGEWNWISIEGFWFSGVESSGSTRVLHVFRLSYSYHMHVNP